MSKAMTVRQIQSILKGGKPGRYAVGSGLYFRVSNEGTGFWVVRYVMRGKRREITIGRYPELSLADANAETALLKRDVKNDIDPLAERQREQQVEYNTVDDLAKDWLQDCEKRLKHPEIPRRVYSKDLAPYIGSFGINQVTPRDIRSTIERVTESDRPTIANDALMYCKQLFRHGIKLNLVTYNPAEPFTASDAGGVEESRSRILSLDEIATLFTCFRENTDHFVRENYLAAALLLCLGIRKGELIAAKWQEFETSSGLWQIPDSRSKTGKGFAIPLPSACRTWLQELHIRANGSEFVFPKRRTSIRHGHMSPDTLNAAILKLQKLNKLQLSHFTIHDFRRTFRSLLSSVGVPGHVAERCLNHKLKGVEGIYDRYDYLPERRDALEKIAVILSPIINTGKNAPPF